jgi:hypothetical protein
MSIDYTDYNDETEYLKALDREWQQQERQELRREYEKSSSDKYQKLPKFSRLEGILQLIAHGRYICDWNESIAFVYWCKDHCDLSEMNTEDWGCSDNHEVIKKYCMEYCKANNFPFTPYNRQNPELVITGICQKYKYTNQEHCGYHNEYVYDAIRSIVHDYHWCNSSNQWRRLNQIDDLPINLVINTIFKYIEKHNDTGNWYYKKPVKKTSSIEYLAPKDFASTKDEVEAVRTLLEKNPFTAYSDTEVSNITGLSRKKAALRLHYLSRIDNAKIVLASVTPKKYQYIPERMQRINKSLNKLIPICNLIERILQHEASMSKRRLRSTVRTLLGKIDNTTTDLCISLMIESHILLCKKIDGREFAYMLIEDYNYNRFKRLLTTEKYAKYAPKNCAEN